MSDAQKWFTTGKVGPLLKEICEKTYGRSRAFLFASETRFARKLLQVKRFLAMKEALQSLVRSEKYTRFDFEDTKFAERIASEDVWILMSRILKVAGPVLLLLRLGDTNGATLSKVKGTVDYIKSLMVETGDDSIEDKMAEAFNDRAHEFDCDMVNASYVLDQQFVSKSRNAGATVMTSFWSVSRKVLGIGDDAEWRNARRQIIVELNAFRMKTGGFALEDYDMDDTVAFWGAAGCHAPFLKKIAFCIVTLPCSSGEAERNWQEVKQNKTKNRNRMGKEKLERMIFVRRFLRLKKQMLKDLNTDFSAWIKRLLRDIVQSLRGDENVVPAGGNDEDDMNTLSVFVDHIEPGEQGRINGKEPGEDPISLTTLKKDNAAKSWLFEKYYEMCLVDKNPEGAADDNPLEDQTLWEHRVIRNVTWTRRKGYALETALRGDPIDQSIEVYHINELLMKMIRDSPHNTRPMSSVTNTTEETADNNNNDQDSDSDTEQNIVASASI